MPVLCHGPCLKNLALFDASSAFQNFCAQEHNKKHHKIRTIALLRAPPTANPMPSAAAIRDEAVSCSSFSTHLRKNKILINV